MLQLVLLKKQFLFIGKYTANRGKIGITRCVRRANKLRTKRSLIDNRFKQTIYN